MEVLIRISCLIYFQPKFQQSIIENQSGATRQALTKEGIENFEIPFLADRAKADYIPAGACRPPAPTPKDRARSRRCPASVRVFGDVWGYCCQPARWDIATLEDLEPILYTALRKSVFLSQRVLPVLRIPNVLHGSIDLEGLKYAEVPEREAKNIMLKKGDILFVRTNGNPDYVGRWCSFQSQKGVAICFVSDSSQIGFE